MASIERGAGDATLPALLGLFTNRIQALFRVEFSFQCDILIAHHLLFLFADIFYFQLIYDVWQALNNLGI